MFAKPGKNRDQSGLSALKTLKFCLTLHQGLRPSQRECVGHTTGLVWQNAWRFGIALVEFGQFHV
jgi:hypothetical protein